MSISIVMLTFNNYEKFLRSMTSMFSFITDKRIKEFIFLDNGSYQSELKTFLLQLNEQISKVRVIFSDKNLGIAKGRKILFDVAQGDYIISLDSDVVILNPPAFLNVFYKALEIPNMMLVGGGGGNHPFFPSLERENIDNKIAPKNPEELMYVDEVAGWFHGFKSSILTKNGGKIEMDEQFNPFWAEDSDFCLQIKVLGGKCSIMGQGLIGHQWSSCDKKKTQITLEDMWNKFQDKWYTKFGKDFSFPMDDKFYEDNYPSSKQIKRKREYYTKIGMIEGHFCSKEEIETLFKDRVTFVENDKIRIKSSNEVIDLRKFNSEYFTYDNIVPYNFNIIINTLPEKIKDLIIFSCFNVERSLDMLITFLKINKNPNILLALNDDIKNIDIFVNLFKHYNINFCITTFPNFNFDLISYIINFNEISKIHEIENVLNLSSDRNPKDYLAKSLDNFTTGYFLQNQISKLDKLNLSFIDQLLTLNQNMMWNVDCIYYEKASYLTKLFNSLPIRETLIKSLKIKRRYINYISPRCSPKHSLERLLGYMKPLLVQEPKILYIVIFEINNQEDLNQFYNNIKNFKNGDIRLINTGIEDNIDLMKYNCNYYSKEDKNISREKLWCKYLKFSDISKYTNVIFADDTYSIESNIDDFILRSYYKNICFLSDGVTFNTGLFSLISSVIETFVKKIEREDSFNINDFLKLMNTRYLWLSKILSDDEENTTIEYFKTSSFTNEEYPLTNFY